jgi:hypothetical protein
LTKLRVLVLFDQGPETLRVPVLTYHALNISGNDYATNDHVAFATDLELLNRRGWKIQPLHKIVGALCGREVSLPPKSIAVSFDDTSNFDYEDLPHPHAGMQRSMLNIMRDFARRHPLAQPELHATTFAIASPQARATIDRACIVNMGWMSDHWWRAAVSGGLMDIANHSWDHNHECLEQVAQRNQEKGNFFCIDTDVDADAQIRAAARYIESRAPSVSVALFAYPYGQGNDYLRREYLPRQFNTATPFVRAAFGTEPGKLGRGSDRWNLPRYVCGAHWNSAEDLIRILAE